MDHDGYKKECVESTAQFKGLNSEVVIVLCHGSERLGQLPVSLCLGPNWQYC